MNSQKQKKVKKFKLEYLLIIVLTVVALVIFFSSESSVKNLFNKTENTNYQTELESKISNLISKIDGVGEVVVTITFLDSGEEVVLKNTETKIENGVKTQTESAVLINGKPYVLNVLSPKVKGVIVVCKGADDVNVKMAITEVLLTTLNVTSDNIRILKMK
ncbi:MAG: hypothetical protein J6Q38_04325 [Clostridia bacterium]|nr:hypothetical protein [Clostridia bacterium]